MSDTTQPLSATSVRMIAVRLKSANKQIFRALLSLASAALLVRVFGLLNQIIVTGRFGAGASMDAYFVAAALPILLAQLAGSAIESAVIPVYARVRAKGREKASVLFSTVLNLLLLGAGLLTALMLIFRQQMIYISAPALDPFRAGLAVSLAPIIFPVLVLMVVISLLEDILNTEGQFGWPAYAGLVVPLTTAILIIALSRFQSVAILCIGTLVGLCLQFCIVLLRARRAGLVYRFVLDMRTAEIASIIKVGWPVLIGALIGQGSNLTDQIFASFLSPGNISALSYALKLISVPIGVIFVSVGRAALPYLARQAAIKDMRAFKETLRLYLWAVGIGTIVLTSFLIVLAHPLVQILFQRGAFSAADTNRTAPILIGFVAGMTPLALGFIIARAFSALGKTKVLLGVTAFSVVANAVFDYIFARLWQGVGIALATSAVYACTLIIMLFLLQRRIGKLDLFVPPSELLNAVEKMGLGLHQKRRHPLPFSIPFRWRQQVERLGIALMVFAIGVFGVFQDAFYTLRVALGSLIVLALLRYRYAVLIAWVMLDVFIGSTVQFFQGKNIDTGLTVPTLLLITFIPFRQTLQRMRPLAFLLIYLLWILAGIGISGLGIGTFLTSWLLLLDNAAVAILTVNLLTTRKRLLGLVDAFLLLSAFVSLYGIYGYITKQNVVTDSSSSLSRIGSIFGQAPTVLAFFLSMVIPLAIYRTLTLHGLKRAGGLMLVLVSLMALGLTLTRSAFISVPVSIVVLIFFLPSRKMKVGLLGGIAALAALMALLVKFGNIPIFERFFSQDITTLNGRTYIWQALLDRFDPTRLLGYGLNASNNLLTNLRVGFGGGVIGSAPHDLFLGELYDHGIIGVTLLVLTLTALVIALISGARKTCGEQRTLFAVALAVFVSVLLQSIDSNEIWNQGIGIYFWIIMALPFALCWSAPKQSTGDDEQTLDNDATEPRLPVVQGKKGGEILVTAQRDKK
ncbi:MAG TPA: murein biosynthesis integral membrane protein MurJ [Ktedonobacteraceae bacterium]|nr:murein biosynthesis integral membrane protein MurJ [Ktedonobacteraceae bacterium]